MTSRYAIKDLENLSGIKAHTLRIWEQRYNIIEPQRTETNIRYYTDEDLKKILNISVLVQNGCRISKVAQMSDEELYRNVMEVGRHKTDKSHGYLSQINSLKIAMLDFNQDLFERVIDQSFIQHGTEETFTKIVGSFIAEVGLLWQTNAISVAHEHFASGIIKQKLYSTIDRIVDESNTVRRIFLLFLPSGELHELGLLYLHFFLKNRGHSVLNLGQSVPLEYVREVFVKRRIDAVVSIFTTHPCKEDILVYMDRMKKILPLEGKDIMFTGFQLEGLNTREMPANFKVFSNLKEMCCHLDKVFV